MTRLQRLEKFKTKPMAASLFRPLKKDDLLYIENFLQQHEAVDIGTLTAIVNRLFLYEKDKPKNHIKIWAVLSEMCSEEIGEKK